MPGVESKPEEPANESENRQHAHYVGRRRSKHAGDVRRPGRRHDLGI